MRTLKHEDEEVPYFVYLFLCLFFLQEEFTAIGGVS